jgi:hypothetical protein
VKRVVVAVVLAACGRSPAPVAPTPACAPSDEGAVVKTVEAMYEALKTDHIAGFQAVTTKDFYAFEGGLRMSGDQLVYAIREAHKSGKTFLWTVTKPEVHVDCRLATITYVNEGMISLDQESKPVWWLESAALVYDGNLWRLQSFHSTRVPPK